MSPKKKQGKPKEQEEEEEEDDDELVNELHPFNIVRGALKLSEKYFNLSISTAQLIGRITKYKDYKYQE